MLELLRGSTPQGSITSMESQDIIVGFLGYIMLFAIMFGVVFLIKKYFKNYH
jgi:hypothetical protein